MRVQIPPLLLTTRINSIQSTMITIDPDFRTFAIATLVYLAIGCLTMQATIAYYRTIGVFRVPYRFIFIWPVFVVLMVIGTIVAYRRINDEDQQ